MTTEHFVPGRGPWPPTQFDLRQVNEDVEQGARFEEAAVIALLASVRGRWAPLPRVDETAPLRRLGFSLGHDVEGDELLRWTRLPTGWRLRRRPGGGLHDLEIVDASGRRRLHVTYRRPEHGLPAVAMYLAP